MIVVFGSEEEASPNASVKPDCRRLVVLGLVLAILAIGVTAGWLARDQWRIDPTLVPVGDVSEFSVGSVTERVLDVGYFDLLGFEGSTSTQLNTPGRTRTVLFVVHDPTAGILALSPRSPFRGCRVVEVTRSQAEEFGHDMSPAFQKGFIDPCHGGLFGYDGTHLAGPGERGLDRFPVRYLADGTVAVDLTNLQAAP